VSKTLREEELQAWQRIVRVLSHEINNSLAPIRSLAGTLQDRLRDEPSTKATDDLRRGLAVIGGRSEALVRFMSSYAQLARLPAPRTSRVDVPAWVARVAALETRVPVRVEPSPPITIDADADQLEQLLINLVRNAADASLETGGGVRVAWRSEEGALDLGVVDDGPGLASSANLFVPFFTTKPHGSGIGLVLCRQIAEAHGGALSLENRIGEHGCVARLRLPAN
jgi:signal transduction histidine kinase